MANDRIASELQGIIACANERGLKLDGESEWRNVSRFAAGVVIPGKGTVCVLGLDKAGYIREISTAAAQPVPQQPRQDAPQSAPVDRETSIRRQAVLNTATNILMSNGAVDVADVLELAARLEAWVLR